MIFPGSCAVEDTLGAFASAGESTAANKIPGKRAKLPGLRLIYFSEVKRSDDQCGPVRQ